MAFRSTLAGDLLARLEARFDITGKHKYYKTVSQKDRAQSEKLNIVLKWMDDHNVHVDLTV
jgi:hypothetical protein